MTRIENAMVDEGHWADSDRFAADNAQWNARMDALDASADAALAAHKEANADSAALEQAVSDFADAINAANDALTKVLKVYRGL